MTVALLTQRSQTGYADRYPIFGGKPLRCSSSMRPYMSLQLPCSPHLY